MRMIYCMNLLSTRTKHSVLRGKNGKEGTYLEDSLNEPNERNVHRINEAEK